MYFIIRWIINTIALGAAVLIVKGVHVNGILSLSVASLVIGLLNASLKPIMIVLTLPLNILTMGLFTLVINTVMILITSQLVRGFDVSGFWAAFTASIFMSVVSFLLNLFVEEGTDE